MREVRYAVRSLLRTPAFTTATVLTLAIGIAAATAIYSVVDTILFRPLPFPGGDRLVRLVEYGPHFREGQPPVQRGVNYQEHQGWRERAKTIEEAAAIIGMSQRKVKTPDGAAGLWGAMVSGNTFTLLQTRPRLGRTLQPADDTNPTVVLLSYDTWQRHYHSDPSIVGRTLEVRMGALLVARPPMFLTVIGVLPQDFEFPTGTLDFVMPIALDPSRPSPGATTIARLAAGISIEAATQEANGMGTAMRPAWPADKVPPSGARFEYQSVKERLVAPLRPALRVILAAVAVLFPDVYSTARKGETIEALLTRFRSNPDVRAAGVARHGLLIGEELHIGRFVPPGKTLADVEAMGTRTRSVSDGFLTAMGVPILQGRDLSPADSGDAPGAIVINRSAARRDFGDANPIGQPMEWVVGKTRSRMTVVGVVEDIRQEEATDPLVPEIFVDYRQFLRFHDVDRPAGQNESAIGFLSFALRTSGDPAALTPAVRESITAIDPNIGIDAIAPMEQLEASSRARQRFYAVMLGVFAGVSALLAAIGVYGGLAYAVTQRTKEIGVRMALGAGTGQVRALVMRRGLALTAIGVALGLAASAAGARLIESMLFGIGPLDPPTFMAVAIGFAIVAALASYFPARQATHVDPAVTLRDE